MLKKTLLISGILVALLAGAGLLRYSHRQSVAMKRATPSLPPIHGELIDAATTAPPASVAGAPALGQQKRKRPHPASVQRRMVLARLALVENPNPDDLPAGTAGTAADWAKTNLPPAELIAVQPHLAGYAGVSFRTLAGFDFPLTKEIAGTNAEPARALAKARARIPETIQALDGAKVLIEGFLLPVRMDDGLVVEFLLMRTRSMCCYGLPPKINEWISVRLTGKGLKAVMDRPIAVAGTFHVGPSAENGFLSGIYSMEGDQVFGPY